MEKSSDALEMFETFRRTRQAQLYVEKKFSGKRIGRSTLFTLNEVPAHLKVYYDYCVTGLARALSMSRTRDNFFLAFSKHIPLLPNSGVRVLLQHEQTILGPGHAQENAFESALRSEGSDENFLVRLFGPQVGFVQADAIIEYSKPNVAHVLGSGKPELYRDKVEYIAPLFQSATSKRKKRPSPAVCTMFGSPQLGRRSEVLMKLAIENIDTTNILEYHDFTRAFARCGILLNLRQFAHFQTMEELRVLPALLQGVIVVTEDFPYSEQVPYTPFLVTTGIDSFPTTVKRLVETYDTKWDEIFGPSEFLELERRLSFENDAAFSRITNH